MRLVLQIGNTKIAKIVSSVGLVPVTAVKVYLIYAGGKSGKL